MAANSAIEWTQTTWNPVTGCSKISPGCKYCYAERMAKRLQGMGQPNYVNGFKVATHDSVLKLPLNWRTPRIVFVNSMSDLFHESIPVKFILRTFEAMCRANWHTYQILTKRSQRLLELNSLLPWAPHIWMGVSVESQSYAFRIDDLRMTGAYTKFVSFEPLIGPMADINLDSIDWAIVGGESGPGARPMSPTWVVEIRNRCKRERIPFFFKQWGGRSKKKTGRRLEGRVWNEMPVSPSKYKPRKLSAATY